MKPGMTRRSIPLIDQCGQIFELANVTLHCVLRKGHQGPHRATLNQSREHISDARNFEREDEEVTLP
jgi:hypothetical protein